MKKNTVIFSSVDYYNNSPKGAVEVCNYSIIDDFIKTGYSVKIVKIPTGKNKLKVLYKNIYLLFLMIVSFFRYGRIVLIYPTIPFAPTTSKLKYFLASIIYNFLFKLRKLFKRKILLYILDYPIEQDKGLQISNVKVAYKYLDQFEKNLLQHSDLIMTYSKEFSDLTLRKCNDIRSKIIQLDFLPVRNNTPKNIKNLDKEITSYIRNYETAIFYSGDLTRKFEKNKLINLFSIIESNTCVVICGNNGQWIKDEIRKENVNYIGFVDSYIHDLIAGQCSFGIILYPNKGYYKVTPTTKLSVYINSILPVLAIETETNANLFHTYKIGECVEEDIIVDKILKWCKEKSYEKYIINVKETRRVINELNDIEKVTYMLERN